MMAAISSPVADARAPRHGRAWLLLVGALAVHVIDEALTGFLDFYNPLVLSIRERFAWFPMPTFTFDAWLALLIAAVVALALITPWIAGGGTGTVAVSWLFATLMFLNGVGHLAGSLYFDRWLPGATSAPLLLAASILLVRSASRRKP